MLETLKAELKLTQQLESKV